jgi:hypothetical protein
VAETATAVDEETVPACAAKENEVWPAATVSLAGIGSAVELLVLSVTTAPPVRAAELSVMMIVVGLPVFTAVGNAPMLASAGAAEIFSRNTPMSGEPRPVTSL